jgi:hypothetical protein
VERRPSAAGQRPSGPVADDPRRSALGRATPIPISTATLPSTRLRSRYWRNAGRSRNTSPRRSGRSWWPTHTYSQPTPMAHSRACLTPWGERIGDWPRARRTYPFPRSASFRCDAKKVFAMPLCALLTPVVARLCSRGVHVRDRRCCIATRRPRGAVFALLWAADTDGFALVEVLCACSGPPEQKPILAGATSFSLYDRGAGYVC